MTLQNDEAKELSPLIADTDLILVKKNQTIGFNEVYINYKPEKSQLIRPIDLEYGQKNLKKPSANGPGLWNVTVGVFGPGKVQWHR